MSYLAAESSILSSGLSLALYYMLSPLRRRYQPMCQHNIGLAIIIKPILDVILHIQYCKQKKIALYLSAVTGFVFFFSLFSFSFICFSFLFPVCIC